MASEKRSAAEIGIEAMKVLGPIVMIGWAANAAINRVEASAQSAIQAVQASVQDVRIAQARHEALDGERVDALKDRVTHVERRQDGMEHTLAVLGVSDALAEDRRPRLRRPAESP